MQIVIETDGVNSVNTIVYANTIKIPWIKKLIFEYGNFPVVARYQRDENGEFIRNEEGDGLVLEMVTLIQHCNDYITGKYFRKEDKENCENCGSKEECHDYIEELNPSVGCDNFKQNKKEKENES